MLSMAEIREPLPPSRCICLINDLIRNTPAQKKLIEFKTKMRMFSPHVPLGEVGLGYWQHFRERYKHKLVNKKGQKFELDRSLWCTYQNFRNMYDMIEDKLIEAKVAKRFRQPM